MYLLPRSDHCLWRGSRPSGRVLYVDSIERRIKAHEIDEEFVERVAVAMRQIASDEPSGHRPSAGECARCPLTSVVCSERVEPESGPKGDRHLGLTWGRPRRRPRTSMPRYLRRCRVPA